MDRKSSSKASVPPPEWFTPSPAPACPEASQPTSDPSGPAVAIGKRSRSADASQPSSPPVVAPTGLLTPCTFVQPTINPTAPATAALISATAASCRFVAVDVETTGFATSDCVIEVAAVEYSDGRPTGAAFFRRVRPPPEAVVHPRAQAVHGISLDDLQAEDSFDAVGPHFLRFLLGGDAALSAIEAQRRAVVLNSSHIVASAPPCADAVSEPSPSPSTDVVSPAPCKADPPAVVLVAHSAAFDVRFLSGALDAAGLPSLRDIAGLRTVCTKEAFSELYPKQLMGLSDTARFLGVGGKRSAEHNAAEDAAMCGAVMAALTATVADVMEASAEAADDNS